MTGDNQEPPDRRRSGWQTRLAIAGTVFVFTYPLTWPWVFVILFKLDELFGRGFGNHPIVEALFNAYSTPLFWLLGSAPQLASIYNPYVRFIFDLFGVNFG